MSDPISFTNAIDSASKVASNPLFTTIIDKLTGFRISQWSAEGEIRKKIIHDEYQKAKESGIVGMQYIENLRRTTNLIDVAVKSAKYIDENKVNDIDMDNDFFWNTIEFAKTISNEVMQDIIAKIIAGEYNKPGSYSMSTLQTLKSLGRNDLELFEKMCSLCINNDQIPEEIFTLPQGIKSLMSLLNIDFASLQSLQNLGLILPNSMTRRVNSIERKVYSIYYFDKVMAYKSSNTSNTSISLPGFYALSNTGNQISKHLKPKFREEFYVWLKENYKIEGFTFEG